VAVARLSGSRIPQVASASGPLGVILPLTDRTAADHGMATRTPPRSPHPTSHFTIRLYVPARADDGRAIEAAALGLERAVPGLLLGWTVTDAQELVPLSQRDAWLVRTRRTGGIPFVCNNDEQAPVTLSASEVPDLPLLDIHAKLPLSTETLAVTEDALVEMAEATHAYWGHATPFGTAAEIARQTVHPTYKPQVPPWGLPALKFPDELPGPEIPHRLGWMNYWSDTTARAIGFPDPSRDADLLTRSRRTGMGGWVVRLTDAPLDLNAPAHLKALLQAYERFPVIGGRASP
jgi:hypothetical protein